MLKSYSHILKYFNLFLNLIHLNLKSKVTNYSNHFLGLILKLNLFLYFFKVIKIINFIFLNN